ncbi:MAG: alkaline phosphatase family protein [Candidatus Hydrogenedentes bacterium]|nr:alkaline phosphatase family protein [Candidatus Hydrogenedentota bacterium]
MKARLFAARAATITVTVGLVLCAGCGAKVPAAPTRQDGAGAADAPVALAAAQPVAPAVQAARPAGKGRVVILGFDGVEPSIAEKMMDAGELPNLATLREKGAYKPLNTANPPQSPTAWSSFTTCTYAGNHGVYDFLRRTPANYLPGVGFGTAQHATLKADGSVAQPAQFESIRKGDSFWSEADRQGARCKILVVPFAYPADDLAQGCMLCGLGVPDIRGTTSTYYAFSDEYAKQESVSGGIQFPLAFQGDKASLTIPGARNPQVRKSSEPGAYVEVPLEFTVDRAARTVAIKLPTETLTVKEGDWTKWIEWSFDVTPKFKVHAISRFLVLEAGEHVRIYMACLQYDPRNPYIRMSTPEKYSGELAERYGLYKTIGWIYDTHALRQDAVTEDIFLDDVEKTMSWREKLALDELDRGNFDLLIAAWTATDRVAHLFWRFRDPQHPLYTEEGAKKYGRAVENTYVRMDQIVGKVMERLQEGDLLMIMSDHGFHSFRTGLNVNTWLIRNGYLAVEGQTDAATASNNEAYLQGYDWPRSKAYSLGLGSIFLNLKGREGQGIVDPAEADALIQEIRAKLLEVTDPATGEKVLSAIYTRDEFKGVSAADAPDLQLGYAEGYQSTKDTVKGSAPEALFEPNTDKWSGEHASSDVALTPGIFFSNQSIGDKDPRIVDLGVTALKYLGNEVPANFEGTDLLGE